MPGRANLVCRLFEPRHLDYSNTCRGWDGVDSLYERQRQTDARCASMRDNDAALHVAAHNSAQMTFLRAG
jgi:hypothetical protein